MNTLSRVRDDDDAARQSIDATLFAYKIPVLAVVAIEYPIANQSIVMTIAAIE